MTAYDNTRSVAIDEADADADKTVHSTTNPAATRAAQAFVASPQMKVLADIQAARAARRAVR